MDHHMTNETTTVSTAALRTLMQWCEDAIDFNDESDELAAKAFETLATELNSAETTTR